MGLITRKHAFEARGLDISDIENRGKQRIANAQSVPLSRDPPGPYKPRCEKTGPSSGFPTRSDTTRTVQTKNMSRCLKFSILEVEGIYYPFSELICVFVFADAKKKNGFLMTRLIFKHCTQSLG